MQEQGDRAFFADVSKAESVKYGIKKQSFSYKEYKKIEISMAGTYQIENAVTAIEVIRTLKQAGYAIEDRAVYEGMAEAVWMGRFSVISKIPCSL